MLTDFEMKPKKTLHTLQDKNIMEFNLATLSRMVKFTELYTY